MDADGRNQRACPPIGEAQNQTKQKGNGHLSRVEMNKGKDDGTDENGNTGITFLQLFQPRLNAASEQ